MESRRKPNKMTSAPIAVTVDQPLQLDQRRSLWKWLENSTLPDSTVIFLITNGESSPLFVAILIQPKPHPVPFLSPPLYEVNAAAQLRPTNPSLLTAGVFAQGFKICPFIWAAQAGKWKGCQSSEPWEKCLVLTASVKTEGRAPSRQGNGLFLSRSSVEKWCKTASVGQWSSR